MSSAWKNSMISRASGAPPEFAIRSRPPSRSLDLRVDEPVGEPVPQRSATAEAACPPGGARSPPGRCEAPNAQIAPLTPCASSSFGEHRSVDLLVHARDAREDRRPNGERAPRRREAGRGRRRACSRRRAPGGGSAARSCGRAAGRGAACRRLRRNRGMSVDGRRPSRSSCGAGSCSPSAGPVVPDV